MKLSRRTPAADRNAAGLTPAVFPARKLTVMSFLRLPETAGPGGHARSGRHGQPARTTRRRRRLLGGGRNGTVLGQMGRSAAASRSSPNTLTGLNGG